MVPDIVMKVFEGEETSLDYPVVNPKCYNSNLSGVATCAKWNVGWEVLNILLIGGLLLKREFISSAINRVKSPHLGGS